MAAEPQAANLAAARGAAAASLAEASGDARTAALHRRSEALRAATARKGGGAGAETEVLVPRTRQVGRRQPPVTAPRDYIRVRDREGAEIVLPRRALLASQTLRLMLDAEHNRGFRESVEGVVQLPEVDPRVLEPLLRYCLLVDIENWATFQDAAATAAAASRQRQREAKGEESGGLDSDSEGEGHGDSAAEALPPPEQQHQQPRAGGVAIRRVPTSGPLVALQFRLAPELAFAALQAAHFLALPQLVSLSAHLLAHNFALVRREELAPLPLDILAELLSRARGVDLARFELRFNRGADGLGFDLSDLWRAFVDDDGSPDAPCERFLAHRLRVLALSPSPQAREELDAFAREFGGVLATLDVGSAQLLAPANDWLRELTALRRLRVMGVTLSPAAARLQHARDLQSSQERARLRQQLHVEQQQLPWVAPAPPPAAPPLDVAPPPPLLSSALAVARQSTALTHLSLVQCDLDDADAATIAALLRAHAMPLLRALDLSDNGIRLSGFVALLDAIAAAAAQPQPPHQQRIETLSVASNFIFGHAVSARCRDDWAGCALLSLDLSHNNLGARPLQGNWLAEEAAPHRLYLLQSRERVGELEQRRRRLKYEADPAMAAVGGVLLPLFDCLPASLRELMLAGNELSADRVLAGGQGAGLSRLQLEQLDLSENNFSGATATPLLNWLLTQQRSLRVLKLAHCGIDLSARLDLALRLLLLPALEEMDLSFNNCEPDDARELLQAAALPELSLRALTLESIGPFGFAFNQLALPALQQRVRFRR
jgi:hypothetical protein